MHPYLLAVLLLLASSFARAQDSLSRARPAVADTARLQPTAADTAAAIHRLFVAARSLRTITVGGPLLVSGVVIGVLPANDTPVTSSYNQLGAGALGVATAPSAPGELLYFGHHYSRRHERRALANWQAHHLAPELRLQLAPTYFAPHRPPRAPSPLARPHDLFAT